MTDDRWIIVGLGNPGPEYAGTRHNAGAMVLALLAERVGARFKSHRTRNDIAEGRLAGQPVTLARPHSYMNLSGGPVSALLGFYKVSPERLLVIRPRQPFPVLPDERVRLLLIKRGQHRPERGALRPFEHRVLPVQDVQVAGLPRVDREAGPREQ